MTGKKFALIIIAAVIGAVATVVILRLLNISGSTTTIAGGVAGGVAGAIGGSLAAKK